MIKLLLKSIFLFHSIFIIPYFCIASEKTILTDGVEKLKNLSLKVLKSHEVDALCRKIGLDDLKHSSLCKLENDNPNSMFKSTKTEIKKVKRHRIKNGKRKKDLELAFQIYKDMDIKYVKNIPILIYNQIILDFPREETYIKEPGKITKIKIFQEQEKEELVQKIFYFIKKIITDQDRQNFSHDQDTLHEIIHLAMASRTQTFEKDTLEFITNSLKDEYLDYQKSYAIKAINRIHSFEIVKKKLKAETVTYFILGDGKISPPVGKLLGRVKTTRTLFFSLKKIRKYIETIEIKKENSI